MTTLFWTIFAVIAGLVIYWLMDWESHHEDGE